MKCQFCGQDLQYGARVCPRCGQPVPPVNPNYNQGAPYYNKPPKKNGTLIAVIILAIVVVAAVVIGIVFLMNNKSEDESKNNGNTITEKDKDNNENSDYVEKTRKENYVDTAMAYVKAVTTKVNEGRYMQLFSTDTLYLIPVGDKLYDANGGDSNVSCVAVESGGLSPFSSTWNYAYVGVIYNGMGYEYYFVAEDGAGYGLTFMTLKELMDDGVSHIYISTRDEGYTNSENNPNMMAMTSSLHDALAKAYRDKKNHITGTCDVENPGCTPYNLDINSQDDMLAFAGGRYQIKIYGTCRE